MEFPVMNSAGQQVSQVELPADIFGAKINVGLMHQAFVRQMANARQGTASTLSRSQIRATGAKWYRQKRHRARTSWRAERADICWRWFGAWTKAARFLEAHAQEDAPRGDSLDL